MPSYKLTLVAFVGATLLIAGATAQDAAAGKQPYQYLGGKIYVSDKRFATADEDVRTSSVSAYVSKIKSNNNEKLWEDKKEKSWTVYYAAFFKQPFNGLEVSITFYDTTDGGKRYMSSVELMLDSRKQTSIISFVELTRQQFGVNKKILMVMTGNGKTLASANFQLRGEAEKYSGKVDFNDDDDDDGNKDGDDDEAKRPVGEVQTRIWDKIFAIRQQLWSGL